MIKAERELEIIQESVESLIRSGVIETAFEVANNTVLLGMGSPLDSLGFVTFITDLEERLIDETGNDDLYFTLDDIEGFNMAVAIDEVTSRIAQLEVSTPTINYAEFFFNNGLSYYYSGDFRLAIDEYDKSILLDAAYPDAYNNRGIAYEFLGQQELADRDFAKAKELGYAP